MKRDDRAVSRSPEMFVIHNAVRIAKLNSGKKSTNDIDIVDCFYKSSFFTHVKI